MARLFENPEEELVSPDAGARVVGVAVGANVWGTFDYLWPAGLGEPVVGQRVHVPFGRGNRKRPGFVVDPLRRGGKRKLKAVTDLVDTEPQLDEPLWKLGEWMADYYMTPLGMALGAMVPSAVGKFKSPWGRDSDACSTNCTRPASRASSRWSLRRCCTTAGRRATRSAASYSASSFAANTARSACRNCPTSRASIRSS